MKSVPFSVLAVVVTMGGGCAGTTPVKSLTLPPVTTIEGRITQVDDGGFTLTDNSGSIPVEARLPDNKKLNVSMGEKVKVFGNLRGGQLRAFDGYVVRKATGEQIVISNPSPHFGFVIQSAFQQ